MDSSLNENSVIIYSPSCCFKAVWISVFCGTQKKIFWEMRYFAHTVRLRSFWTCQSIIKLYHLCLILTKFSQSNLEKSKHPDINVHWHRLWSTCEVNSGKYINISQFNTFVHKKLFFSGCLTGNLWKIVLILWSQFHNKGMISRFDFALFSFVPPRHKLL